MKILILSDTFHPEVAGGADMVAFRLAKEFLRQGHDVRVVTTTVNPEKQGEDTLEKLLVTRIYSRYPERWRSYVSLWNPQVLTEVKKILMEFKPDVVHAHNVHMHLSYASLLLAKRWTPKVYLTCHDVMPFYPGTFTEFIDPKDLSCPIVFNYRVSIVMLLKKFRFRYNPLRNTIIRMVLRSIDGVIPVSHALKDALTQNGITTTEVIYNGIDVSAWTVDLTDVEAFRCQHNLKGTKVVLFGGRLSGGKGADIVLQAMRTVLLHDQTTRLLVVGKKDTYAERMEKRAKELGIEKQVVFAGWLSESEMKKAYAASILAVVPSVCFDSSPNGNFEAFASRRTVVSTCFGGSREVVVPGENGYIVNPLNIPSMSEAISRLLSDKEKARKYGENGHRLVAQSYSTEVAVQKYLSLFSK